MKKKNLSDQEQSDENADEVRYKRERQDMFVCFNDDRDYRTPETILTKARLYTGIAMRQKMIDVQHLDYVFKAIEMDHDIQQKKAETDEQESE